MRGYRRSLESLEKVIDPCQEQAVSSRRCLATGLADLRRNAEAQRVLDQGWELCKRSPEKSSAASLRSQLGLLFLAEGHSRPALRTLEDALRLHDEAKTPEGNLGFTLPASARRLCSSAAWTRPSYTSSALSPAGPRPR